MTKWSASEFLLYANHSLNSTGGWLTVFAGLLVLGYALGALLPLFLIHNETYTSVVPVDLQTKLFIIKYAAIGFVKLSFILWMLYSEKYYFRVTTTWLLFADIIILPVLAYMHPNMMLINHIAARMFYIISGAIIWGIYLNNSERVRVTFEGKCRIDKYADISLISNSKFIIQNIVFGSWLLFTNSIAGIVIVADYLRPYQDARYYSNYKPTQPSVPYIGQRKQSAMLN